MAVSALLLASILSAWSPAATADHACDFTPTLSASHAPPDQWSNHSHPEYVFIANDDHCDVVDFVVTPSWRASFTTPNERYHPTLSSGVHNLTLAIDYRVAHTTVTPHCHAYSWSICLDWHDHVDTTYTVARSPTVAAPPSKIDITPPALAWGTLTGPHTSDDHVAAATRIHIEASDAHSGLAAVTTSLDGGPTTNHDGGAGLSIHGADGPHTLDVRARDHTGNEALLHRTFILDTTAPALQLVSPQSQSARIGPATIAACGPTAPARPPATPAGLPAAPLTLHDFCTGRLVTLPPQAPGPQLAEALRQVPLPPAVAWPSLPLPFDPMDLLPPIVADEVRSLLDGLTPSETANLSATRDDAARTLEETTRPAQLGETTLAPGRHVVTLGDTLDIISEAPDALTGTREVLYLVDGTLRHRGLPTGDDDAARTQWTWDTRDETRGQHALTIVAIDHLDNAASMRLDVLLVTPATA